MKRESTPRPLTVVCIRLMAVVLVLILVLASCQPGSKTVRLRFKYEPGMQYSYELTKKSISTMLEADSVLWHESRSTTKQITDVVRSLSTDSTAEIHETSLTRHDRIVKNDSTIIDTNTYNADVVVQMMSSGKVVDFQFPTSPRNNEKKTIGYYKHLFQQGYPVFPDGDLPQGHSWTQSTSVMLEDGLSEATTTYEIQSFVRERGHDCVVIAYSGNLVIPIETSQMDSVTISGVNHTQFTGVMYFCYKEGMMISTRNRWTIDGERTSTVHGRKKAEYRVIYEGDDSLILTGMKPAFEI